uniref:dynamin GTPase n=1 Tax=Aegilops tauschii TaxID=37682 RepID=M8BJF7_AEGTA
MEAFFGTPPDGESITEAFYINLAASMMMCEKFPQDLRPTGENGATRAPIVVDLQRDPGLSTKSIVLQIDSKSQQVSSSALRHSLQDRLSKATGPGRSRTDEIYLKLRTSTAPPLKLIDLPGIDQRVIDDSTINEFAGHNDAILIVVIPAMQAPEVASSRALKLARDIDPEGTRTIGVLSKIDQAASDAKTVACVQAILSNKGPRTAAEIEWVALIGQSVAIASAQSGSVGSENSLETAWRAEAESLKSILTTAPQNKLGRIALVDTIAKQIRKRMKVRLPNLLTGLQGKSQVVKDELARLGESMVQSPEGTRAVALELCREFEDKFLAHVTSGEGSGWKIVASFEGKFPDRIKQLPLDRHFDLNNVKRIVLEADGYQPYLISPEKGLKSLIKGVLEMAKEPSRLCVEEVHRVLLDIVNATANGTPGLGRYPPFKREIITIASNALDTFKSDAKKMVVALVDMERAFVPPQHFIRLVQRRMERQRREEEVKTKSSKKAQDAEQAMMNKEQAKSSKDKSNQQDKDTKEGPNLQVAGPGGEITAGYLLKKSAKNNEWSKRWFVLNEKSGKLGYTKKQEERHFRGVIVLEECNLEEIEEEELSKTSKDSKKANGAEKGPSLVFKITNRVAYKTVLKAHSAVVLKAESMADKIEWVKKIKGIIQSKGGSVKSSNTPEGGSMRQSHSDGSLDTMARRPADPEEELRWMSQEVRGYVEAVLNSLAANVPKAIVLCQVEKAKEDMLNQLYSSISLPLFIYAIHTVLIKPKSAKLNHVMVPFTLGSCSSQSNARIEELLQEDHNAKRRREKAQKQSTLLSKLTRQLSVHDNRAAAASYSDDTSGPGKKIQSERRRRGGCRRGKSFGQGERRFGWIEREAVDEQEESGPQSPGQSGEDWRSAFSAAANGSADRSSSQNESRSRSADSRGRRYENGDANGANSGSRRTPNRLPPAPPKY